MMVHPRYVFLTISSFFKEKMEKNVAVVISFVYFCQQILNKQISYFISSQPYNLKPL